MRKKLIHVAIEMFGKQGFDGVGTRKIAAAAGTSMASITYHFGGKEGLYLAAAEHIFDQLHIALQGFPSGMPGAADSRESRLAASCAMLRRIGDFMLQEQSAPFALFIGREQQAPTPEVFKMMDQKMRPVMEMLVSQVEFLRPDLDDAQVRATTLYLFGMAITLRHSRASLRLLLGIEEIDPETGEMLLGQLTQSARLVLSGGNV